MNWILTTVRVFLSYEEKLKYIVFFFSVKRTEIEVQRFCFRQMTWNGCTVLPSPLLFLFHVITIFPDLYYNVFP